jgi:hypothetical protein
MTCNENPKEDAIVTIDPFIKLDCHISKGGFFSIPSCSFRSLEC